jgi:exodeoxyribonuclease V alpha subunit
MKVETIDKVFARKLLEGTSKEKDTDCVCALQYLFASVRQGHTCISVDSNKITPSPELILEEMESNANYLEAVLVGFQRLPQEILQEDPHKLNLKPIVKQGCHYYLQKYFFLETQIATQIEKLSSASLKFPFSLEEIETAVAKYSHYLNVKQQEAIIQSLHYPLHVLTGGPGTGKTYTVMYLLQTYRDLCQQYGYESHIALAAPTGKATSHLKDKFLGQQGIASEEMFVDIHTLHSLLKIRKKADLYRDRYLFKDLIIIDESSMIDLYLWKALLSAIPLGARVVLMGDPDQLPPVETGMIFEQFIKILPSSSLKSCMRTESPELLNIAQVIRERKEEDLEELLRSSKGNIHYYEYEREVDIFSLDHPLLKSFLEETALMTSVVLSPMLQGLWGVDTLNARLHEFFSNQGRYQEEMHIPIMIRETSYAEQLYNGDTGILVKHKQASHKDYAVFEGKEDPISAVFLPSYQYAYALSVHKSQGSEYHKVLLLLPEGSAHFGKEILYTAITRAKHSLMIISKKGVLNKCLKNGSQKNSALANRIVLNRNS